MAHPAIGMRLLEAVDFAAIPVVNREAKVLHAHRDELMMATRFGMWKASTFLASQIVEALLAKRIAMVSPPVVLPRNITLAPMVELAKKAGILSGYDKVVGTDSITAALVMRNWSAHFALWSQYPTELRATHSIALMLCAVEALFPTYSNRSFAGIGDDAPAWRRVTPRATIKKLFGLPKFASLPRGIGPDLDAFCEYAVRHSTIATIVQLAEQFQRLGVSIGHVAQAIERNFGTIVKRAAMSADLYLIKMVRLLKRLDLREHASVFAVLLPIDSAILRHLLKTRSSAWVAFYVKECYAAEPDLFASKALRGAPAADIAGSFWREFSRRSMHITNVFVILKRFPPPFVATILRGAPIDLLCTRIQSSRAKVAVHFLPLIRRGIIGRDPALVQLRDRISAVVASVVDATKDISQLQNLPHDLHLTHIADDVCALAVARSLLRRAVVEEDLAQHWTYIRRIIWDTIQYIPSVKPEAIAASYLLVAKVDRHLAWQYACAVGFIALLRETNTPVARWNDIELREVAPPPGTDQWERQLGILGLASLKAARGEALSPQFYDMIADIFIRPEPAAPELSQRLAERIAAILASRAAT